MPAALHQLFLLSLFMELCWPEVGSGEAFSYHSPVLVTCDDGTAAAGLAHAQHCLLEPFSQCPCITYSLHPSCQPAGCTERLEMNEGVMNHLVHIGTVQHLRGLNLYSNKQCFAYLLPLSC